MSKTADNSIKYIRQLSFVNALHITASQTAYSLQYIDAVGLGDIGLVQNSTPTKVHIPNMD